jgi:ABC-type sugar transport system ATPase subunit
MSIELKNVTKQFGEVAAVNNVTFSVNEGELMALLGPSGGGKTTVLRMIAGLEVPTSGDISELRAVQEHERVQEHCIRPEN